MSSVLGVAAVVVLSSCIDPPPPDPVERLTGSYTGWIICDRLDANDRTVDSLFIKWTFTNTRYQYSRPDSIPDSTLRILCDWSGTYGLFGGLVLTPDSGWDSQSCVTRGRTLRGTFVILLHTKTELHFVQGAADSVVTVRLASSS